MRVHLLSADLPELACRLALADQRPRPGEQAPPVALDLSGEQLLMACHPAPADVRCFEAVPVALGLWEQLEPRLESWLGLLQLAEREALLIPPLPGVEVLLQCVFLAEQLDGLATTSQRVTVLLPPPGPAMALLELARTGPDLVEGLLEPLLNWWDQTRLSLGGLERLVGLDLPKTTSLRLEARWKDRLERMAALLSEPESHQLTLSLESGDPEGRLVRHRVSRLALRGTHPTRILLHGPEAQQVRDALDALLEDPSIPAAVITSQATQEDLAELMNLGGETPPDFVVNQDAGTLSLRLLGVRRGELQVRQVKGVVVLLYGGQRRLLDLPATLATRHCVGAKLEGGRLELRFKEP